MSEPRSRLPGRDRPEPRRPEPRRPETPWVAETEETRGDAPRTGGTRAAGSAAASRPVAAPLSAAPSERGPTQGPGRALTIRSRQPGIGRALRAGGADDEPVTRSPTVRGIRCCESGLSRRQRGAVKVGGLGAGSHVGSGSPHPSGGRRRQMAARMRGSQGTADTRPYTGQAPEAGGWAGGPAKATVLGALRQRDRRASPTTGLGDREGQTGQRPQALAQQLRLRLRLSGSSVLSAGPECKACHTAGMQRGGRGQDGEERRAGPARPEATPGSSHALKLPESSESSAAMRRVRPRQGPAHAQLEHLGCRRRTPGRPAPGGAGWGVHRGGQGPRRGGSVCSAEDTGARDAQPGQPGTLRWQEAHGR